MNTIAAISVIGTRDGNECKFFFDSLTGDPLFVEVSYDDFDEPTIEYFARVDVPDAVTAVIDRYLLDTTVKEKGLYGILLWLDRKVGRFTPATRAMWRVWNWYVAQGAQ